MPSMQENTVMAGERGLLSNIETGNANMSDRTGQQGRSRKERIDRKVRKYRAAKKNLGRNRWARI